MKRHSFPFALLALFGLMAGSLMVIKPGLARQNLDFAEESVRQIASVAVQDIISSQVPRAEKVRRFRELFMTRFDMRSVSRFVLGRWWRKTSAIEQKRFVELFQELNIYTWVNRFQRYDGQELVVTGTRPDGKRGAFVDSRMVRSGNLKDIPMVWRLRWRDDSWKVVDLVVEGISMALTFRSEYSALLADPSITVSVLNNRLSERVRSIRGEGR